MESQLALCVPHRFRHRLGAFYLPLNAERYGQLRIPWGGRRCNHTSGRSTAPRCAQSTCELWLNLSEARESQARQRERD